MSGRGTITFIQVNSLPERHLQVRWSSGLHDEFKIPLDGSLPMCADYVYGAFKMVGEEYTNEHLTGTFRTTRIADNVASVEMLAYKYPRYSFEDRTQYLHYLRENIHRTVGEFLLGEVEEYEVPRAALHRLLQACGKHRATKCIVSRDVGFWLMEDSKMNLNASVGSQLMEGILVTNMLIGNKIAFLAPPAPNSKDIQAVQHSVNLLLRDSIR